jgi:hypothetical protein
VSKRPFALRLKAGYAVISHVLPFAQLRLAEFPPTVLARADKVIE